MVDFLGLHYRGLEDHGTLLTDAIKAKPTEDTRLGCGSKHHLAGGRKGRGTKRGHQEAQEIGEKVCHCYRHGVIHSGHSVSQSVYIGPGRLGG